MFKDNLKNIRKKKKISQYKLAEDLHVAQSTVAGWENGNREPDFETLEKLADYFNVTIDYLFGRTNNPSPIPQPTISSEGEELLEKLKNLPADRRKAIEILMNYEEQSATKSS